MKYTQIQQLSKNEEGFVGMLHLMQQPTVNHVQNYMYIVQNVKSRVLHMLICIE